MLLVQLQHYVGCETWLSVLMWVTEARDVSLISIIQKYDLHSVPTLTLRYESPQKKKELQDMNRAWDHLMRHLQICMQHLVC